MWRDIASASGRDRVIRAERERGFALLLVLWTLVLFSLLVSVIAATGSGRTRQAADLVRNARLGAAADGGVSVALFHLLDASAGHWPADGAPHRLRLNGVLLTLRVTSQAGRVNPNLASAALLAGLLQAVGADPRAAQKIAAAIIVWRFPSGVAAEPVPGRDYRPPGAPFESLDELGLVAGMTPTLLTALLPHLSLYHDGDPDPSEADPVVRRAITPPGADPDGSGTPQAAGPPHHDPAVVEVVSDADDGSGHRAARRAIALTVTGGQADATGTLPPPFRIVAWGMPSR